MEFKHGHVGRTNEITRLFRETFAASEGADEGKLIGKLVEGLLLTTPPEKLFVFSASEDGALAGCIMFTCMDYAKDPRKVALLSPVAVAPARQGRGVGQALIRHGLEEMARLGAQVAITYGDPDYYARTGFHRIEVADAAPPYPLSQPEGWLGRSLTDAPLTRLVGPSRCVKALSDPAYW